MRFLSLALAALAVLSPAVVAETIDTPFGAVFIGTSSEPVNTNEVVEGGVTVIDDSNFVYGLDNLGSIVGVHWRFVTQPHKSPPDSVYVRTYEQNTLEPWRFRMIQSMKITGPTQNLGELDDDFYARANEFWYGQINISPTDAISVDNGQFVGFYFPSTFPVVGVYAANPADLNKLEWVMPGDFKDTVNWSPAPRFYFPPPDNVGPVINSQKPLSDGLYNGGVANKQLVSQAYIPNWTQYREVKTSLGLGGTIPNNEQADPTKWVEGFVSRANHRDAFKFIVRSVKGNGGGHGDPQFAGFQGQDFQFHGMADEVFNLISTPKFQLNGNFKYLSAGKCDYNETECYTHPGTYVDQLGFSIGDIKIKAIAGSHDKGARVWMNDVEVHPDANMKTIFSIFNSTEQTGYLKYASKGVFTVDVPNFAVKITNSDYFFNMEVALKHSAALHAGQKKVSLKQKFLCMSDGQSHETRLSKVEDFMANYYPRFPIHGLIGQTWRNVDICGHQWVGDASDYVTSGLFAADSAFNYYGKDL